MQVRTIQNNYSNKPAFGGMVFKPMYGDYIKAIENNPSFNKLSKELESIGKDLVFSTGSCCDASVISMYAGKAPHNEANSIYLGQVAGSLPANCEKMVKQLKTYSSDALLEAINLGKKLFDK